MFVLFKCIVAMIILGVASIILLIPMAIEMFVFNTRKGKIKAALLAFFDKTETWAVR